MGPKLYIACGISGAIQYVAGISGSDIVVAINKDANAPIFDVADYGVVGNPFDVMDAMLEEIEKTQTYCIAVPISFRPMSGKSLHHC